MTVHFIPKGADRKCRKARVDPPSLNAKVAQLVEAGYLKSPIVKVRILPLAPLKPKTHPNTHSRFIL